MSATGLLTARCDPYGAESQVQLLGGMYPESHKGRIMWHCSNQAQARYRMVCTGGEYGTRLAPGGEVAGFHCEGGHRGQVMPLCKDHVREIQKRQSDLCPACAFPPQARQHQAEAEYAQAQLYHAWNFELMARWTSVLDQARAALDELNARGLVHKCPLKLIEVS